MGLLKHWRYTWYDQIIREFTEVSPAPEWPCQGSVVPLGPIAPALTPVSEEDVTVCGRRKQIKFQILPIQNITIKSGQILQFWEKVLSGVIHSWNQCRYIRYNYWHTASVRRTSYQKFCPNKPALFCLVGLGPRMSHGCWKPGPSQAW